MDWYRKVNLVKNTIVVRVDASLEEGWFYEGAGIYRHVRLVKTAPLHVAKWGTFVTTDVKNDFSSADVTARVTVNDDSPKDANHCAVHKTVRRNQTNRERRWLDAVHADDSITSRHAASSGCCGMSTGGLRLILIKLSSNGQCKIPSPNITNCAP